MNYLNMELKFPDYDKSTVSLISSVYKHFKIKPFHKTLPELDGLLKREQKNVIIMLFDGLGTSVLEKNLPKNAFLRKHFATSISAVFPPTTVAATTSIQTGLTPKEHGWLGWDMYFKELDKNVTVFTNNVQGTNKKAAGKSVAEKYMPIKSFPEIFEENNAEAKTEWISAFSKSKAKNLRDICKKVLEASKADGEKYIYAYYNEPDSLMHVFGTSHILVKLKILQINLSVKKLCKKLKNTLVIVTADHGHVDVKPVFLSDFPEITDCILRPFSIEARAAALFVKDEYKAVFPEIWNKYLGDKFRLFSKDDVRTLGLFGTGAENPHNDSSYGDFLAVATDKYYLENSRKAKFICKGAHAGITKEELEIPFIAIDIE